jgi:hypothetical protein
VITPLFLTSISSRLYLPTTFTTSNIAQQADFRLHPTYDCLCTFHSTHLLPTCRTARRTHSRPTQIPSRTYASGLRSPHLKTHTNKILLLLHGELGMQSCLLLSPEEAVKDSASASGAVSSKTVHGCTSSRPGSPGPHTIHTSTDKRVVYYTRSRACYLQQRSLPISYNLIMAGLTARHTSRDAGQASLCCTSVDNFPRHSATRFGGYPTCQPRMFGMISCRTCHQEEVSCYPPQTLNCQRTSTSF